MTHNHPPTGFISHIRVLVNSMADCDIERLRSNLREMAVLRDQNRDTPAESWWNAALTISQLANELLATIREDAAIHSALDKDQRDAKLLVAISKEPMNQMGLALRLHDDEGNLSKRLDELEARGLIMRRRESRSKFVFLSSLGDAALKDHNRHCRIGSHCILYRASVPDENADGPEPLFSEPESSAAMSDLMRKVARLEGKLREEMERMEAANRRVKLIKTLVEHPKASGHPPAAPLPAAKEAETEARLLEMAFRMDLGQSVLPEEVEPVVAQGLVELERQIDGP